MSILQAIRTFFFYLLLGTSSFLWCTLSFFIAPFLPFKARYRFINVYWCRCALWLTKVFLNIRFEVEGRENVPGPAVRDSVESPKHLGDLLLSAYFSPLSQVLKRELLYVPFFGWAMAMLRPIAIDRDNPKAALKHVAKKGDRAAQGRRLGADLSGRNTSPLGTVGKFSRGGTALAVNANLPVLPHCT